MGAAANALLGNCDTAVITVRDYRKKASKITKAEGNPFDLNIVQQSLNQTAEFPELDLMRRKYMVQFNPKELILNANQPISQISTANGSEKGKSKSENTAHEPPRVSLSATIFFDRVNLADTFVCERFSLSPAALATNVATGIGKLAGVEWTVQPQVEGFLAALRNPYTRTVTFTWKDFTFDGVLSHLSAEYTMFSTGGRPVRAKIRMKLLSDRTKATNDRWKRDFDGGFGKSNRNLVAPKGGGMVGSFLNF
jgi:hypothetical protein